MEQLTSSERARIAPYVTNLDGPVFGVVNLPPAVIGALFARYSRSAKPLRRLLLEEFLTADGDATVVGDSDDVRRDAASAFHERVVDQYGDDSVMQLAGAALAVEGASNILTKVLEWGRLANYLEQSTRYINFADRPNGRYRYHRPAGVMGEPTLAGRYTATMDGLFETYTALLPQLGAWVDARLPDDPDVPAAARQRAVKARALDGLRGLLPAATTSNLGIYGSAQAYEQLLLRLAAHPLAEAREYGQLALVELRKMIPEFLRRVDRPDRGLITASYLADTARATAQLAQELLGPVSTPDATADVRLLSWDPDGEARVAAHALWEQSAQTLDAVRSAVGGMSPGQLDRVFEALVGERHDRRHKPGRSLEQTTYTFEITCDYGAYRDLQRHRLLTLQAQTLNADLGYVIPAEVHAAGLADQLVAAHESSAALYRQVLEAHPHEAPYAVSMAHRIRFTMTMNAREALHLIELRSQPQGHDAYRRVAVAMLDAIGNVAGHRRIAAMMSYADRTEVIAGRLGAEVRQERRATRA